MRPDQITDVLHLIQPDEANRLRDHLDAVNEAIHKRGGHIDWQHPMDPERARSWCVHGQAWALPDWSATVVVADADPLWDDDGTPSLYFSKLAVAEPGSGVGVRMLAALDQRAAALGRRRLRCDCLTANDQRRWYEDQLFTDRGDRKYQGRAGLVQVTLYERPVSGGDYAA